MIEFTHVSKDFGSGEKMVRAVRDVSLTIQDGEIFGIIGFSGAGKSTLVRCINLLERPTNGTVVVDGKEMTALSPKELRLARRKIGMIFQHFNLMPSRTVFGNVAYPLQGQGLSKQAIQNKVRKLLKLVDIADKETAYPSQLSGGQKQRVAIARALANDPKVLLCDEATSALDPQTTKAILTLLKDLNQKLNLTIVMITHEMAVVKEICDHVAIMEHGQVVEQGSVEAIFADPQHPYTIGLMGSIPSAGARKGPLATIPGAVPLAESMPNGCRFATRCPFAQTRCHNEKPSLTAQGADHLVACFRVPLEQHIALGEIA